MRSNPHSSFTAKPRSRAAHTERGLPAPPMLQELMASGVVAIEDWETLSAGTRGTLSRTSQGDLLLSLIVEHGLLTEYQAGEVALGKAANLVLNNYRILDRLGGGRL